MGLVAGADQRAEEYSVGWTCILFQSRVREATIDRGQETAAFKFAALHSVDIRGTTVLKFAQYIRNLSKGIFLLN